MRFGEYLAEKGILGDEDIRLILDNQNRTNAWFGTLAYLRDFIALGQVGEILEAQRASGLRFGEQAVDLGLMTESQVDEVVDLQQRKQVRFGELAVSMQYLTPRELRSLLQEFQGLAD